MMERTYAAELDDTNTVLRVIVGTADWAADNLGGTWVQSATKVGADWTWVKGEWVPPEPDDLHDLDDVIDALGFNRTELETELETELD